jgi:hypothetical protein
MIGRLFEQRGPLLVPADPTNPSPEWFNRLPLEDKKVVMASGLGVRLLEEGLPYVIPIFWLGVDEEGAKLTNGTAFLLSPLSQGSGRHAPPTQGISLSLPVIHGFPAACRLADTTLLPPLTAR